MLTGLLTGKKLKTTYLSHLPLPALNQTKNTHLSYTKQDVLL
mgnify:CR=1 FL=1